MALSAKAILNGLWIQMKKEDKMVAEETND
jgi:hypothetical protein